MPPFNGNSGSAEAGVASENRDNGRSIQHQQQQQENSISSSAPSATGAIAPKPPPTKKKRNLPGMPDPEAEVVALSPKTLMATMRFVCEICSKGFPRDQNLQLHRRGHNLPWKLRRRTSKEPRKRVYICPELSCVHNDPSRALGDLTGIKKHYCRKHGEKTWKCNKCNRKYAVQSDWKAHSKICGTREYRCNCGTLFSRKDSFITHRTFCDALARESAIISTNRDGAVQQLPRGSDEASVAPPGARLPATEVQSPSQGATSSMRLSAGTGEVLGIGLNDDQEVLPPLIPLLWAQGKAGGRLGMPPKTPKLSLLLAPDPGPAGPGPPVGRHMVGRSQLQVTDAMQLNNPGSSNLSCAPGMPTNYFDHFDTNINFVHHPHSQNAGNLLSNPFALGLIGTPGLPASSLGSGVTSGNIDVPGISNMLPYHKETRRRSNTGPHSVSTSASFVAGVCNGSAGSFPSPSLTYINPQSHPPITQMSATALLQKAAQMGATGSNTSSLRPFGMTGLESASSGSLDAYWQGFRQDQTRGTGMPSLSSRTSHQQEVITRPGETDFPGYTNSRMSPKFGAFSRLGGIDTLNTVQGLLGGLSSFSSIDLTSQLYGEAGNMGPLLLSMNTTSLRKKSAEDAGATHTNNTLYGKHSHGIALMTPNLGPFPKVEEGSDTQTRDFLGVSVASSMTGPSTGIGNSLTHSELGGTMSIRATGNVSHLNIPTADNMMAMEKCIVSVPESAWNCY